MSTLAFMIVAFAFFGALGLVALLISNAISGSAAAAARGLHHAFTGHDTRPPGPTHLTSTLSPGQLRSEVLNSVPSTSSPSVSNAFQLTKASPQDLVYTYGNVMDQSFTATVHFESHPTGSRATALISRHTECDGRLRDVAVMRSFIDAISACTSPADCQAQTPPTV